MHYFYPYSACYMYICCSTNSLEILKRQHHWLTIVSFRKSQIRRKLSSILYYYLKKENGKIFPEKKHATSPKIMSVTDMFSFLDGFQTTSHALLWITSTLEFTYLLAHSLHS